VNGTLAGTGALVFVAIIVWWQWRQVRLRRYLHEDERRISQGDQDTAR
jgi:hypothetical protein